MYIAVHRDLGGGPGAIVGGELLAVDGCIAYKTLDGLALPAWPPDTYVWNVDGTTILADRSGTRVAAVGEESFFPGGFDSLSGLEAIMDASIPPQCLFGNYLLITELKPFPGL